MKRASIIVITILVMLQLCSSLSASPTTAYDAEMVVTGWLKADSKPLGSGIGRQIMSVGTVTDDLGEPVYYVVYLQPSGFVIVSANDLVEPIIAFSGSGTYDPSSVSPLKSLVTEDLKARNAAVRNTFVPLSVIPQVAVSESQKKWNYLINLADVSGGGYKLMAIDPILDDNLSDIRVPPLAQSKWGQGNYYDSNDQPHACYNYCTPQLINNRGSFVEGDVDNYPVGCVAVAVAQFVLSQRYPQEPLGPQEFTILVEGQKTECTLHGGDGPDGAYNWDEMVLVPDDETTDQQRRAIGALCFDAAIAVDTEFGRDGSGASLDNAVKALLETFEYDNAVWAENEGGHVTRKLFLSLFNPNLDAGIPVILGFRNSDYPWYGHAAICDGYGYNLSKLYHHLNMGWEGQEDCWYSLPDIAYPDMVPYDAITQCVYNIFTDCTGEIISGRIIDSNGVPFEGVTVTAQSETVPNIHATETNSNGIYALIGLNSDTAYTIAPDMLGYDFDLNLGYGPEHNVVTTGRSGGNSFATGNIWGVDFVGYRNYDPNSTESQVVCTNVKLTPSDGARDDHFGSAIAISGDYIIVGAYGDDDNRGAAYIFKREGTDWIEQAKLRRPVPREADDYFGYSVSISGDYAIVGAGSVHSQRNPVGAFTAYIFRREGTIWTLQTELRSFNMETYDRFGSTVSISGNYAIVGSPRDDSDTEKYDKYDFGSVNIFEWNGESWTQQEKIFASHGAEHTYFGDEVSIGGDYAIVSQGYGGHMSFSYGPVYIYKREGTNWMEQAVLSSLERSFGNSISINDGYAFIGAAEENNENGDGSGSVYVFKREDANWTQQTILTPLDGDPFDSFGRSLSLNENCFIVGAPDDDDHYMGRDSGSAYIFELDGAEWKQHAKLTALDAQYDDFFGTSVAIDGDYAIVGAPGDDDNGRESGSVYVFKRIGSIWTSSGNIWGVDFDRDSDPDSAGQESQAVSADVKLTASDGARDDHFGSAIAISRDYAIVGAYGNDNNRGAAYIFEREGTSWIEQTKLRKPGFRQTDDYFGYSVDINGDYAIVGAYGSDIRRGAAYVFKRDGTSWMQQTELRSVNMATYDSFGTTVSISGNYAIVGSPEDDSDTLTSHHRSWGSVCIFELDGETWIQQEKLFASNGSEGARFGAVVSICGDYAIVSSGYYYPSPTYGPVYIMKSDGITWTEQVMLSSLERSFGNTVSISEDYAIIGAPEENNDNGNGSGSVYVYIREDAGWEQQIVLTASDGEPFDSFGRSLSINGNHIIIGAPDDDDHDMGRDSGSAYIFELDGIEWTQRAKLTSMDAQYDDFFGSSVAVDGDYAIVGAPGDDDNGRDSGSVYVFKRIGLIWTP